MYNRRGKKRKYEKKIKIETPSEPSDERRGGLILRLPRMAPVKEESTIPSSDTVLSRPSSSCSISRPDSSNSGTTKKVDWLSMVPSISELSKRVELQKASKVEVSRDPTKVYLMKVRDRDVLALPYLDVSMRPDFIRYKYPDPAQYYAEENFAYGADRIA